jgi:hypothetical protein
MAGVKGRSGGARPGSGRKKQETIVVQASRRDTVLEVISDPVWKATVTEWVATARATGNFGLLFPLLPYIMGAAKQELNITGRVEHVRISEIRQALGISEIRALPAPKKASGE